MGIQSHKGEQKQITMRNFTTEDFSGAGQYLVRNDKPRNGFVNTGFLSSVMYKVGYSHGTKFENRPDTGNVMLLISMSDGLSLHGHFLKNGNETDTSKWTFVQWNGVQEFCDYLNNPELSQEYRFASQEEVVRVVMYQTSRWR